MRTFYGISVLIEKYAAAVGTFYGILVLIEKYAHVSKNVHTFPNSTTFFVTFATQFRAIQQKKYF